MGPGHSGVVEDKALDRWFSQERRVPVLFSPVHGAGTWPPTWLAPAAYGGQNFPNSGAEAAFEQFTWVVDGMLPLASITRRVAEMPELPWWHSKLAELVDRVPPPPRPPLAPDAPAKARHLSDEQLDYLWLTLHGYSGTVIAIAQGKSPAAVNRKISRAVKHMRSVDKHDAGRKAFGYR